MRAAVAALLVALVLAITSPADAAPRGCCWVVRPAPMPAAGGLKCVQLWPGHARCLPVSSKGRVRAAIIVCGDECFTVLGEGGQR